MKILLISMPSIHVIRWIENLSKTDHELYWFDILDRGKLPITSEIKQITDWKKRKVPYIKGEYWLSSKFPSISSAVQSFLEVTINEKLEKLIQEIQPDVIHSFEMQSCCYPILKTLDKFPNLKWLYSCWGSDLFYYQNKADHLPKIKAVLQRINYLHTDSLRDYSIAQSLGFKGNYSGVIPGGGGFYLEQYSSYLQSIANRNIILVKGYQHQFGRGLSLVKALHSIQNEIQNLGFEVVVFGAHKEVIDYVEMNQLPFRVHTRHGLSHEDLLQLMGQAILYVGNSISDGIPNTLLEAIIMGAFPIQSNPGKVTAEIITHGENGLLIENPNNADEIAHLILKALQNTKMTQKAFDWNQQIAKNKLDYDSNRQKILALYHQIEKDTCG